MLLKSYWVSWPQHKLGAQNTETATQSENENTGQQKDKCHLIYLHLCETGRLTSLGFSLFPTPHRMTNVKGHRAAEPLKPQTPTLPSCHPKDGGGRQQKTTWHCPHRRTVLSLCEQIVLVWNRRMPLSKTSFRFKNNNKNLSWQGPGWGKCSYVLSEETRVAHTKTHECYNPAPPF